jgi:hypothetical protein
MMRDTWEGVGERMDNAITKVGGESLHKKKEQGHVRTKEAA